ncbi:hypothetical protein CfE428DRAFT_5531 [Chthoniobacter flavus Ellin428]|uniref:Uncharacterized protein n=1 Tax=Chthoniobacter flavus Ellin428 TaxID=497964 RepID=B4D9E1_9BACT|nr:hypothetical protein [Chthoniobacter flavus]EDY16902.1 hypothetical protein CfE428DRAFT_5531 [Chthoniobacter flavus Ellin428]TCO87784.1 hypothetical protein EV701_12083 [Chthoniobacter flavus]
MILIPGLSLGAGTRFGSTSAGPDADATAIVTAITEAGGTVPDGADTAIQTFVKGLKSSGAWNAIFHMWGFVGANAASHALDWRNFGGNSISWNGTLLHDAIGTKGDGSGYGDTTMDPSLGASRDDFHFASYVPVDDGGDGMQAGLTNEVTSLFLGVSTNGNFDCQCGDSTTHTQLTNSNGGIGLINSAGVTQNIYHAGTLINSLTVSGDLPAEYNLYVCAVDDLGSATSFSAEYISFLSYGRHIPNPASFQTLVQNLQTALGRAV